MCHKGRDRGVQGAISLHCGCLERFSIFFIFISLQGGRLGEKVAGLQGGSVGPDHLQTRLAKLHRAITP